MTCTCEVRLRSFKDRSPRRWHSYDYVTFSDPNDYKPGAERPQMPNTSGPNSKHDGFLLPQKIWWKICQRI